jgi:methylated-DNA-protein-cysteine methyltransferase related protein
MLYDFWQFSDEKRATSGAHLMSWDRLYALVKKIPRGKVLTYGALAKATRIPGGARAAGHAMAAMPKGQGIPWHRVVGAGGRLLIRESQASLQRKLLLTEGTRFVESRVDMKTAAWNPPRVTKTKKRGNPASRKKSS